MTPKETDPDLPMRAQESPADAWVSSRLLQVRGTEGHSAYIQSTFEGGRLYLHYLHRSLVSGQTTGREHSPAHQKKTGFKIY